VWLARRHNLGPVRERHASTAIVDQTTLTEPHDLPLAQPDSHRPAGMRMASIAARVSLAHVGDHGVPGRHIL